MLKSYRVRLRGTVKVCKLVHVKATSAQAAITRARAMGASWVFADDPVEDEKLAEAVEWELKR